MKILGADSGGAKGGYRSPTLKERQVNWQRLINTSPPIDWGDPKVDASQVLVVPRGANVKEWLRKYDYKTKYDTWDEINSQASIWERISGAFTGDTEVHRRQEATRNWLKNNPGMAPVPGAKIKPLPDSSDMKARKKWNRKVDEGPQGVPALPPWSKHLTSGE